MDGKAVSREEILRELRGGKGIGSLSATRD